MSLRQNVCPTCKEKHYFRKEDGICDYCKMLITAALESRKTAERLGKKKECVIVSLPTEPHGWPGFYECLPRQVHHWHGYRDRLRNALIRVYRTLGTPMPQHYADRNNDVHPWLPRGRWDGCYDADRVMLPLRQYRAMKAMRLLIDAVIAETFEAAVLEGRDLLKSLANCTVSPEEFGKKGVEFAQKMQERKQAIDEDLSESEDEE